MMTEIGSQSPSKRLNKFIINSRRMKNGIRRNTLTAWEIFVLKYLKKRKCNRKYNNVAILDQ